MIKKTILLFEMLILFFMFNSISFANTELKGDINKDGRFTSTDVSIMTRILFGQIECTEKMLNNGDLNYDSKINSSDVSILTRIIIGQYKFPLENKNLSVYSFSQSWNSSKDPQIYSLKPDIIIRAWNKWKLDGTKPSDFNFDYVKKCHENNVLFIGGITASVLFESECKSKEQLLDWATRDAGNNLVLHNGLSNYRASLANPSYRKYLVDMGKIQIDGGVDGIFYDEADGMYTGEKYDGNEGYDDYFCKDFNKYLIEKYPDFKKEDWIKKFSMTEANYIREDYKYNDLRNNFNYRLYLIEHEWTSNPLNKNNPLAAEWGKQVFNRPLNNNENFKAKYSMIYWKDIVDSLRAYARVKYNKEILITSNGIFPYVDFQSVGLYNYNNDNNGNEANYVPITLDGHLNGTYSLVDSYSYLKERNKVIAGDDVPVVLFIDWPCKMMDDYYALPLEEKKDFWRIYAAESYSCGLYFSFHLKTSMENDPTATMSGIYDFIKEYSAFYKNNELVYKKAKIIEKNYNEGYDNISTVITENDSGENKFIHMINHNYDKALKIQENLTVSIKTAKEPSKIEIISPDFNEIKNPKFTYNNGEVKINIDSLYSYNVIKIHNNN